MNSLYNKFDLYKKNKETIFLIIQLLFYSFPIILLLPSGYITAHVTLLSTGALILFYKKKIKIQFIVIDYIIFLFFIFSIFSTLKNISTLGNIIFIKSILDLRFAIFFLIIRNLLHNKIVNLKFISVITLITSIFLSLDILLQHLRGYDILGFLPFDGRYNGVFESEAIAGSYIQKFFLLSIFSIFLTEFKRKTKFFFMTIAINLLGAGILLSLDRMPFIIFIFILVILLSTLKNYRFIIFINLIISVTLFICLIKNYDIVKIRYENLNRDINFSKILNTTIINNNFIFLENKNNTTNENKNLFHGDYSKLYRSAFIIFSKNYLVGSGVKSFNYECVKLPRDSDKISCNNHPHNIYLEIIVNLGIIGIGMFIIILFFLIKKILKTLLKNNINDNLKTTLILFLTIFISELIPFRSYGSIFQTVNGSIFWFFLALIGYVNYAIEMNNNNNNNI